MDKQQPSVLVLKMPCGNVRLRRPRPLRRHNNTLPLFSNWLNARLRLYSIFPCYQVIIYSYTKFFLWFGKETWQTTPWSQNNQPSFTQSVMPLGRKELKQIMMGTNRRLFFLFQTPNLDWQHHSSLSTDEHGRMSFSPVGQRHWNCCGICCEKEKKKQPHICPVGQLSCYVPSGELPKMQKYAKYRFFSSQPDNLLVEEPRKKSVSSQPKIQHL